MVPIGPIGLFECHKLAFTLVDDTQAIETPKDFQEGGGRVLLQLIELGIQLVFRL